MKRWLDALLGRLADNVVVRIVGNISKLIAVIGLGIAFYYADIFLFIGFIWIATTMALYEYLRPKSPFPTRVTNTIQFIQLFALIPFVAGFVRLVFFRHGGRH